MDAFRKVQTFFTVILALATVGLALFTSRLWLANDRLANANDRFANIEESRSAAESERAINRELSRLAETVTAYRNSVPCSNYVLSLEKNDQIKIAKFEPIDQLPGEKSNSTDSQARLLSSCLGRLYLVIRNPELPSSTEAKVAYIRKEIYARLNALEEAAIYYTGKTKCDDNAVHLIESKGQQELRRQICGLTPEPISKMVALDNEVQSARPENSGKSAEALSRLCLFRKCPDLKH